MKTLDVDFKGSVIACSNELKQQPLKPVEVVPYSVTPAKKPKSNPKNIVSGVGYGTWSLLKGIGTGLSGIVVEPYKGAKENGVKGASIGVAKGIIGLVVKPCVGTYGLVEYTVKGTVNTPGTIGRGIKKAFTRTPKTTGAPNEPEQSTVYEVSEAHEDDHEETKDPPLLIQTTQESVMSNFTHKDKDNGEQISPKNVSDKDI